MSSELETVVTRSELLQQIKELQATNKILMARMDAAEKRAEDAEKKAEAAEKRADALQEKLSMVLRGKMFRQNVIRPSAHVDRECPICTCSERQADCETTHCQHHFHQSCLIEWVALGPFSHGCPVCRHKLL